MVKLLDIPNMHRELRINLIENLHLLANEIEAAQERISREIVEGSSIEEVVDARGNFTRLNDRLKTEKEEIEYELIKKAETSAISGLQSQIDNLVAVEGDENSSNAEIVQARRMYPTLHALTRTLENDMAARRKDLLGDVKGVLIKGLYNASDGEYNDTTTGWYAAKFDVGEKKSFVMKHPMAGEARVAEFAADGTFIRNRILPFNESFSIGDNCASIGMNFRVEGASPEVSHSPPFEDIYDIYTLVVLPEGEQEIEKEISDANNEIKQLKSSIHEIAYGERQTISSQVEAGLYARSSMEYSPDAPGWGSFYVASANPEARYLLSHDTTGYVRLMQADKTGNVIYNEPFIQTNEIFELLPECDSFAINIQFEDSDPVVSGMESFTPGTEFVLYQFGPSDTKQKIMDLRTDVDNLLEESDLTSAQTLKVLSIGNSFSRDGHLGFVQAATSANVEVIAGNLYIGSGSLAQHDDNASNNTPAYEYYKRSTGNTEELVNGESTIEYALLDEQWDVITLQQVSGGSGRYETFQPYLDNLIAYIRNLLPNSEARIAMLMTWAYSSDSDHGAFSNYNSDQMEMYESIVGAYQQAMYETDIDLLIPCGTAIQNARSISYLNNVDREITEDGYHLGALGDFIAGLTFFEVLLAEKYNKDTFTDISYDPEAGTKFLVYLGKIAARQAKLMPFKLTSLN